MDSTFRFRYRCKGLEIYQGRSGVYVVPNSESLDLTNRIIDSGKVGGNK